MPASEPIGAPVFAALRGVRLTARPAAIDAATWPADAAVLRIAPDDAFVAGASLDDAAAVLAADPHAIVEDEPMFRGAWLDDAQLQAFTHLLEWPLPDRPGLGQGFAAGLAVKLALLADGRSLLVVSASVLHEVPERFGRAWSAVEVAP